MVAAVVALCGFLLGTFPTAGVVARRSGRDVAGEGSGNPGATNVYRIAGRRAAMVVFVGDALKGAVPAAVGLALSGRTLALAAGAAAVVGHCFPPQRRLRGGRGVATSAGVVAVVDPVVAAVTAVLWFLLVRLSRRASLGSLAAVPRITEAFRTGAGVGWHEHKDEVFHGCEKFFRPGYAAALLGRDTSEAVVLALLAVLVVFRHAPNIGRLARGSEGPLGPAGGGGPGLR